ncbi:ABC transporter ATP-binding protein [Alcaligenaceae bacterium]|nr:ABC transporter ATP-binding protein [Alcaligenaceae bacterium]
MLELRNANVFYDKAQALHDISLQVDTSNVLALVGRNGAGKSTILKAFMGQVALQEGSRQLNGADITTTSIDACSRMGIAFVPEDRQIFPGLTAHENLLVAGMSHQPGLWTMERVYALFPRLQERSSALGTSLSGGEQQMLAIGRALITNPSYLLLDEPTEGLAPVVVDQIVEAITTISQQGMAVILVEQNFRIPQRLAQHFALIDSGRIVWSGLRAGITDELENMLSGLHG